jgi:hypothetical protein
MSSAEAPHLEHLLQSVAADPAGLINGVLARVAGQFMQDGAAPNDNDPQPADLVASALGDWLARTISSGGDGGQETGSGWLSHYRELLDRNSALAAALGACDCWGQDRGCPVCNGAGMPGWLLPDEGLFAAYVQPAVSAGAPLRMPRTQTRTSTTDDKRPTGG